MCTCVIAQDDQKQNKEDGVNDKEETGQAPLSPVSTKAFVRAKKICMRLSQQERDALKMSL